jgi:hypothetical protein
VVLQVLQAMGLPDQAMELSDDIEAGDCRLTPLFKGFSRLSRFSRLWDFQIRLWDFQLSHPLIF